MQHSHISDIVPDPSDASLLLNTSMKRGSSPKPTSNKAVTHRSTERDMQHQKEKGEWIGASSHGPGRSRPAAYK